MEGSYHKKTNQKTMLTKHVFIKFDLFAIKLNFLTLHTSKRHQIQKLFNLVGEYWLQHILQCRQNNFLIILQFLFRVNQQTTLNNMYGNCEVPKLIKTLISFLLEEVLIIKRKYFNIVQSNNQMEEFLNSISFSKLNSTKNS